MRISRRWLVAGAIGLGAIAFALIALGVVYPRLGAWMIKKRGAHLGARLGRDIRFGRIDVSLGHAVMHDVDIRGLPGGPHEHGPAERRGRRQPRQRHEHREPDRELRSYQPREDGR